MLSMLQQITSRMLAEFDTHGIEDTPTNRVIFLEGMVTAWEEDKSDDCFEKTLWVSTAKMEISMQRLTAAIQSL